MEEMQYTKLKPKSYALQRNPWKYLKIILLISVLGIIFTYQAVFTFIATSMDSMDYYKELEEDTIDARQTCQLPLLHPFEKEVLSYFRSPRPISCRSKTPVLTYIDDEGYLRYNLTAFSESGYSIQNLVCEYQEINRVDGQDQKVYFTDPIEMTGSDKLKSDFVYVACQRSTWLPKVYSMYHAFAQKNPNVRQFRDDNELGVAVIGLDSVSRLNFMRQLPRSYRLITNTLNGVVLKGFNKVGENTFPNIVPILTGNEPLQYTESSTFDDWPFIWNALNKDRVSTLYGEDLSRIMTFSWWGDGFKQSPTTHYFRPFWIAVDSSSLDAWSSPMCLGPIPKHKLYLGYLKSFLKVYKNSPVFMFSLENEPSHDYLNTVGIIDEDLEEFLLSSFNEGLFNRTALFVLSDHGQRFDEYRHTKQGKIEDRMPMVSVILPKWFSEQNPDIIEALNNNSKRLTSSYDLYSTFLDVFRRETSSENDLTGANNSNNGVTVNYDFKKPSRGTTLFRQVPLNRTCKDAGIPEMYCVCAEDTKELKTDDNLAVQSAKILLDYINNVILEETSEMWTTTISKFKKTKQGKLENQTDLDLKILNKCSKLTNKIEKADLVTKLDGRMIVHMTLKTYPNGGIYEGRVEWTKRENKKIGRVHEEIIRVNRYGDQADCLPHLLMILVPLVRSVCYCT